MKLSLSSPALEHGGPIPKLHTCDSDDLGALDFVQSAGERYRIADGCRGRKVTWQYVHRKKRLATNRVWQSLPAYWSPPLLFQAFRTGYRITWPWSPNQGGTRTCDGGSYSCRSNTHRHIRARRVILLRSCSNRRDKLAVTKLVFN